MSKLGRNPKIYSKATRIIHFWTKTDDWDSDRIISSIHSRDQNLLQRIKMTGEILTDGRTRAMQLKKER
jgi:hypothetical protein